MNDSVTAVVNQSVSTDVSEKIQPTLSWHLDIKKNHVGLFRDERVDGVAVGTEGAHLAHLWHFL